jgi:tyrosyl-tRNA synthetase
MWLGAHRMSPYRFYQAWIQADDADMRRLLLQVTFLSLDEVDAVVAEHDAAPHERIAQKRLAEELTALVHGRDAAVAAVEASNLLFGAGSITDTGAATLETLVGEIPTAEIARDRLAGGVPIVELVSEIGLASSRSEARGLADQGGLAVNGVTVDMGAQIGSSDLLHGRYALLRKGKRHYHLVVAADV